MKHTRFSSLLGGLLLTTLLGAGCLSQAPSTNTNESTSTPTTPGVTTSSGGTPTSTPSTPTSTGAVTSTPSTATSTSSGTKTRIRDFSSDIQTLVKNDPKVKQEVSGPLLKQPFSILYEDVTSDNQEDAIVFIDSEGTAGTVEIVIVGMVNGQPKILQRFSGEKLAAHADAGRLVILQPRYLPVDQEATQTYLVYKVYAWNGTSFVLKSQDEVKLK